jgi:hypothetical protein
MLPLLLLIHMDFHRVVSSHRIDRQLQNAFFHWKKKKDKNVYTSTYCDSKIQNSSLLTSDKNIIRIQFKKSSTLCIAFRYLPTGDRVLKGTSVADPWHIGMDPVPRIRTVKCPYSGHCPNFGQIARFHGIPRHKETNR